MPLVTGPQFMSLAENFRRIEFGHRASVADCCVIRFNITVQPLFHKNFELLFQSFETYMQQGYQLYILADRPKQIQRLEDIFKEKSAVPELTEGPVSKRPFTGVEKTLHEGFIDDDLRVCFFTDHQISPFRLWDPGQR